MIGGLLKSTSRLAILAATGMFVGGLALTPAQAADLGGDCCADLEERVADLEATTARKGNRKVSLKIYGQVNRAMMWLDDDDGHTEFHSVDNAVSGTEVRFAGSAKMTSTTTAGFVIELKTRSNNSSGVNDAGVQGLSSGVSVDKQYVYLKNASLGTLALGKVGMPTSGVANISLAGNGVVADSAGDSWNGIATAKGFDLEAPTGGDGIAYISPTLAGFTISLGWLDVNDAATGSTDGVDVYSAALRYAGEFGPIRLAAGIGYNTNDDNTSAASAVADSDGANVMGSIAMMHTPTGLNIAFAAGKELDGGTKTPGNAAVDVEDSQFWHVQGGISQNFFGPGKTSVYGEYGNYDRDEATAATLDETTMYGFGLVQSFDSAATELYIAYRHWESEDSAGVAIVGAADDVDSVMAGMRIKF